MNLYPTRRAVALAAAGAPVALVAAAAAPAAWPVATGWVLLTAALVVADALLAPAARALTLQVSAPALTGVGRTEALEVAARFDGAAPRRLELAVGGDERLEVSPARRPLALVQGQGGASLSLHARRRGEGRLDGVWARWTGPLGLVWRQKREVPAEPVAVTPDVQSVREQALRLFTRDSAFGQKAQLDVGEGAEFHALKEFQTGMDLRSIDWKQSARHARLVGREYRIERNHNVVLALDTGRLMSAPVAGEPRIDHAIRAALLLAFVSLKLGDRVGLFGFDAKPRVASGLAAGVAAFGLLQRLAAALDYSTEETNFTLGLTSLSGRLDRRALVVVFTDFVDPTSAELMVENLARLIRKHLVVFVTLRDEELEGLAAAEPQSADDVSRAVVAAALLKQRQAVLSRLRRIGVQIVEAHARDLGPALVNRYLDIKQRELV